MSRRAKVLEIKTLGKVYRLGKVGSGTLSGDLKRQLTLLKGGADPNLPIDTSGRQVGDKIWALRDLNFEVAQGEVLGLIGKNGAGKSTLLKLLSQVTTPSTGHIKAKGRIASLLEVGTGMHPELTGRENVFLNGAILGMGRLEIADKFDQIVEFSGCETYIDTPVKRYSSGMKVRLGFAVAAFLEPDILIVDEVLAVGDAEFQKKAIARMQALSQNGDRTVIFVSHNMTSVRSLCSRVIWLEAGQLAFDGGVEEGIARYLGYPSAPSSRAQKWDRMEEAPSSAEVRVRSATFHCAGKGIEAPLSTDDAVALELDVERLEGDTSLDCTLQIFSESGTFIAASSSLYFAEATKGTAAGTQMKFHCEIPANFFNQGVYRFGVLLLTDRKRVSLRMDDLFTVAFASAPRRTDGWMGTPGSLLLPGFSWKVE